MKKKRIYRIIALCMLAVIAFLSVTACTTSLAAENAEPGTAEDISGFTEAKVEKKTYPYVKDFDKGSKESSVNLYFVEGGDIPYMSVSEYMDFYSDTMKVMTDKEISFKTSKVHDNFYAVSRADRETAMLIDTKTDTLYLADFNRLTQPADVDALVTIMDIPDPKEPDLTDLIDKYKTAKTDEERKPIMEEMQKRSEGEPNTLFRSVSNSINRTGESKVLQLSEYLIDIVEHDGECYFPLQTLNDLFMGPLYLQFVFNGKKLYGFPYGSEPSQEIYEAGPEEMSQEFAMYNFDELCFLFDCFYGLKEDHNISDFGRLILANQDICDGLTSTDPKAFDNTLRIFISQYLDDGHSALNNPSWREGPLSVEELFKFSDYSGFSLNSSSKVRERFAEARNEAYPNGVPMYEEVGDTAFITFDSFTCRIDEDFSKYYDSKNAPDPEDFVIRESGDDQSMEVFFDFSNDADDIEGSAGTAGDITDEETAKDDGGIEEIDPGEDTIWLLNYANERIHRKNSPIKNVVVDLSQNGGGQSAAAVFAISWLTGKAQVALKDTFTSAETIMTIAADVNMDNEYTVQNDSLSNDFNVYVLTSPLSFSCGNLVPAACKMAKSVTLVGQQSGGGSCVVLASTTASGACFQMSGSKQLAVVKNGAYYNIDQGITPDIPLTKAESFYDRKALAEYLKECK